MTKAAVRAVGTILQIGTIAVSDLTSISSPSVSREEIDVTTLDSQDQYREFIGGFKDGGEVTISGFFVPSDSGQSGMYDAMESGDVQQFSIIYPPQLGASWSFEGVVTSYSTPAELEGAIQFESTIRVSGKPTLNLTPGSGFTNLVVTGAGGALEPAFAAATSSYAYTGVTAASVTVTASGTGKVTIYVDGNRKQTVDAGTASDPIAVAAGKSVRVTLILQESGKTEVVNEIIVVGA